MAAKRLASCARCCLVCLFVMPGAAAAQAQPQEYAREYRQTFQGPPEKPQEFFFIGPDAEAHVKYEPQGLRIKFPAGHPDATDTGLMTRFGVQGDFEITLKYDVLQAPAPIDLGSHARFCLSVLLDKRGQYDAAIHRYWAEGQPGFMAWMNVPGPTPGIQDVKAPTFPAQAKTGQLRLTRRGAELSYFAAQGEGEDASFKLLQKHTFGADNLRNVRITAAAGGANAALDVRITDFVVRAAAFPRLDRIALKEVKPLREDAPTYDEPFQGKPRRAEDFVLIGKNADKHVKFEPDGLRVTLQAGTATWQPTGVATAFGVTGDFDVSVRYEILAEPEPADSGSPGVGTRINLSANIGGINIHDASIRRTVTQSAPVHVLAYTSADKLTHGFPLNARTGRLRLVRTGDIIAFYLSEGLEKEFKLLRTHPFDAADLKEIQISAQASGPKAVLDVRFTDLHLRAASLPRKAASGKTEKGDESSPRRAEKVAEPQVPTKDYAVTYDQSFKGAAPPTGWEFTAPPAEQWVQFEPAGLRLTMPEGAPRERRNAGIQTAFGVKGDFEITLSFEFLKEPAPSKVGKFATRLLMGIALDTPNLDTPTSEVATLNRSLSSQGERNFTTWMRNRENPKGVLGGSPTSGPTGRLRLVRSGDELFVLTATGADQPFKLIKTNRFGADDVKRVSITGTTGHEKAMLDVRLTDFRIRADAIPGLPSTGAAAAAEVALKSQGAGQGGRIALLLVGLAIPLLGVGALAVWFLARRRSKAATPIEAARAAISFSCPKCAKTNKADVARAGKKVKCSRCNCVVLVPFEPGRR